MLETNEKIARALTQKKRAELYKRITQAAAMKKGAILSQHEQNLRAAQTDISSKESEIETWVSASTERAAKQIIINPEMRSLEQVAYGAQTHVLGTLYRERDDLQAKTKCLQDKQLQSTLKIRRIDESIDSLGDNIRLAKNYRELSEINLASEKRGK